MFHHCIVPKGWGVAPIINGNIISLMHYVYVIKSLRLSFTYIGQARDLRKRFGQHNDGVVRSTKPYKPFRLVYYEAYTHIKDAVIREKKLKQYGSSWGHLKKRLKYSLL